MIEFLERLGEPQTSGDPATKLSEWVVPGRWRVLSPIMSRPSAAEYSRTSLACSDVLSVALAKALDRGPYFAGLVLARRVDQLLAVEEDEGRPLRGSSSSKVVASP